MRTDKKDWLWLLLLPPFLIITGLISWELLRMIGGVLGWIGACIRIG